MLKASLGCVEPLRKTFLLLTVALHRGGVGDKRNSLLSTGLPSGCLDFTASRAHGSPGLTVTH